MEHLLEVSGFSAFFKNSRAGHGKSPFVQILDNISFTADRNEVLGIVGESGCGKTTLTKGLMNQLKYTEGSVKIDGEDIHSLNRLVLSDRIQTIFQNPLASFNPRYTIASSLRETAKIHHISDEEYEKRLGDLLERTKLSPELADRYPAKLSGGQLQRFCICRALLIKPEILIADEAVSALDVSIQTDILKLMLQLHQELNIGIIFISHDLNVVRRICDRILVMYLGEIVESGPAEQIFRAPEHPYTKMLIASRTKTDPDEKKTVQYKYEDIPNILEIPDGCRFQKRCPYFEKGICDTPDRSGAGRESPCGSADSGHWSACRNNAV